MFICDICDTCTQPHEPMTRLVAETRPRAYRNPWGDVIGRGWEIVRERAACPRCALAAQEKG